MAMAVYWHDSLVGILVLCQEPLQPEQKFNQGMEIQTDCSASRKTHATFSPLGINWDKLDKKNLEYIHITVKADGSHIRDNNCSWTEKQSQETDIYFYLLAFFLYKKIMWLVYLWMVSSRPLVLASSSRNCFVVSSSSSPAEGAPSSSHLSLSAFDYKKTHGICQNVQYTKEYTLRNTVSHNALLQPSLNQCNMI